MSPGERYRVRADELDAVAQREVDPEIRIELRNLARGYRRLAEQADRNARTDIVYETPPRNAADDAPDLKS